MELFIIFHTHTQQTQVVCELTRFLSVFHFFGAASDTRTLQFVQVTVGGAAGCSAIFCRSLKGIHAEIGHSVLHSFSVNLTDH